MSAKKKFLIILTTLFVIFLISVVGLVIVLSASVQAAKAMITVNYKANMVSAQISARYALCDSSFNLWDKGIIDMVDPSNSNSTILEFSPESNTSGTLVPPVFDGEENNDIVLSKQYKIVVFEFTFTNLSDTIGIEIATQGFPKTYIGDQSNQSNINIYFFGSDQEVMFKEGDSTKLYNADKLNELYKNNTLQCSIAPKTQENTAPTYRYYLVAMVSNILYDAVYGTGEEDDTGFVWSLFRQVANS